MGKIWTMVLGFVFIGIGIGIGIGVGIGAAAFKGKKTVVHELVSETSKATTPKPAGTGTTIKTPSPTITTSSASIPSVPPTTSMSTTVAPNPASCPPTFSQFTTSTLLLSLVETNSSNNFRKYSTTYVSPADSTIGMLVFEFKTTWGSWYLDDVSIKKNTGSLEIIDNGGFETGNLGSKWKFCDPRYPWLTDGTVVSHIFNSGSYSYATEDTGDGSEGYLTQTFTIDRNEVYTIEFFLTYSGVPNLVKVTLLVR